jgi:hypothetical protein
MCCSTDLAPPLPAARARPPRGRSLDSRNTHVAARSNVALRKRRPGTRRWVFFLPFPGTPVAAETGEDGSGQQQAQVNVVVRGDMRDGRTDGPALRLPEHRTSVPTARGGNDAAALPACLLGVSGGGGEAKRPPLRADVDVAGAFFARAHADHLQGRPRCN